MDRSRIHLSIYTNFSLSFVFVANINVAGAP